jgi:phosphocarrier protein FPr/phosphocarrier protein
MTSPLILHAPLAGWLCGLDDVPDEVFAARMMGEGLAIEPLASELLAPCDATVVLVAPTAHAVTLRHECGAEILLHIGLETVALGGDGFMAHVAAGQKVRQGETLLSFDMDRVALGAKSLVTPMVVTNSEAFELEPSALDRLVEAGEPIGTLRPKEGEADSGASGEAITDSTEVVVPLAHGIHARPAARIAALAKSFSAQVTLRFEDCEANARSPVSVMGLGVSCGDRIEIAATGSDAGPATAAVAMLIERGIKEAPPAPATRSVPDAGTGVCAVPGLAIGPAAQLRIDEPEVEEDGAGIPKERNALAAATEQVRASLSRRAAIPGSEAGAIAGAHLALLDDEEIAAAAQAHIERGKSAGYAWREALRSSAETLRSTANDLIRERIADLRDLERQVLFALSGVRPPAAKVPNGSILIARDLLPSQLMEVRNRVAGICTAGGGPTSHVAIIAAAAGIPTLVAAGEWILDVEDGTALLLDATAGRLIVDPADEAAASARAQIEAASRQRASDRSSAMAEGRTADGVRIELFANLASTAEAIEAVAAGAEGCGLLRTEFLFLDREVAPSEDEQLAAYQQIADALEERPVIVRTLDVGGDKPLPYLPIPAEENPALGLRGVRTSLWRPDLLDDQLRAILRVRPAGRCRIMVPMIVSVDELRTVRARLDALAAELGHSETAQLGVMIETPAAAILADQLAAEADFFSIGSNDLTQYALAMDRTNPLVAADVDAFHPAVLRLIGATVGGARVHGRQVALCGGLASDPDGAALLVGLGVTELSVTPGAIPGVKARLRGVTLDQCREIAARALEQSSPSEVRKLIRETLSAAAAD